MSTEEIYWGTFYYSPTRAGESLERNNAACFVSVRGIGMWDDDDDDNNNNNNFISRG